MSPLFLNSISEEETDSFSNPFRGWYHIAYYMVDDSVFQKIDYYNEERQDNLELAVINISPYQSEDIDEKGLEYIRSILNNYRERHIKVILRGVYDHEGKACEKEPFHFAQVKRHIEQMGSVIKEYADIILVWQGVLVGNWGEMHSSRFIQKEKITTLVNTLKVSTENRVYRAVRTPVQWRYLYSEAEYEEKKVECKDSLFDDAIFASETHLGTFGNQKRVNAGWQESWCREDELDFITPLCKKNPNGGEMVCPDNHQIPSGDAIITRLQKMCVTYLNRDYDKRLLNALESMTYENSGPWHGRTIYDYVSAHLGYRYVIKNAFVNHGILKRKSSMLHILIENTGFADITRKTSVYMEWEELGGTLKRECILEDIRLVKDSSSIEVTYPARNLSGNVYLVMELAETGECVRFANQSDSRGRTLIGAFAKRFL